ncbi:Filamin-interacting protein FAM101B [Sciurus carolinensis]|uniref:Filamin-interacting protein FAM101B n=1 Tax=Sciurus carolinensis TaxID=30640 RepID=A0AA41MZN0_SCICA|nr:Filamin-interacting protein FAM101B [Sciurus carolinensis]
MPELVDMKKKGDGVPDSGLPQPQPQPQPLGAEVRFAPRHKPTPFLSTTILYPKYPKTVYTTTLDYNCHKKLRRFLSSVELEATEFLGSAFLSDEC